MKTLNLALCVSVLLLVACGKKPEPPKPGEPQSGPQGRAETQAIRNLDAVGYSGTGIANKVDGALDANDQRKQNLDAALDAQSDPK